ncbi:hypothetical protein ACFFQW_47280 [Umezawaea endophytica]|uniref:Protein kinase domain-containing protein n=1 Tax=Umezawaea endophytica TaxID=1654476 RepID=A0A9X3A101_9PSEU|nr:hypothetical protein [Umezawaea endophytica]MCS7477478.1 hypothetical protein [Umezawaea endophytica]
MSGDQEVVLHGRDAWGAPRTWRLRTTGTVEAGSVLRTAEGKLNTGDRVVLRTLPPASAVQPEISQVWLDNEIRAVTRTTRLYRAERPPAELPRLLGYQFDSDKPFALLTGYSSTGAATAVGRLLDSQRTEFTVSLLRALAHLDAVDLVHGNVGLPALRLDGSSVRLVNFEHAVLGGEPSRSGVWPPAHHGDDVLAAGRLLYEVYTGVPTTGDGHPSGTAVPWLRSLLSGVFADNPHERPSAVDLLRRVNAAAPAPSDDQDAALHRGRARFDTVRSVKSAGYPPQAPPSATAAGPAPRPHDRMGAER